MELVGSFVLYMVSALSFTQVSAAWGLGTAMTNPESVDWEDYDCDGDFDILMGANSTGIKLYRHDGTTFTDVTTASGIAPLMHWGAAWGDMNGDGYADLFCPGYASTNNRLYRNDGTGTFTDVTAAAGIAQGITSTCGEWNDFDGDGDNDLHITAANGASRMYVNSGAGTFTDQAAALGLNASYGSINSGGDWGDFDGDGDNDLALGGQSAGSFLYRNDITSFTNVAPGYGINFGSPVGSKWVDYNSDGLPDIIEMSWTSGLALYRNNGGSFTNVTAAAGLSGVSSSMNTVWGDFDSDGDMDMINTGNSSTFVFENTGSGTFTDVTGSSGVPQVTYGHGGAAADFNGDGRLDFLANEYSSGNLRLMQNTAAQGNWLEFQVLNPGGALAPSAVGAAVWVFSAAGSLVQIVDGGHIGHGSEQDWKILHFGIGAAAQADSVVAVWPGGTRCSWAGSTFAVNVRYTLNRDCSWGTYSPCEPLAVGTGERSAATVRLSVRSTPSAIEVRLTLAAAGEARVTLFRADGRTVRSVLLSGKSGENLVKLDARALPRGVYIVLAEGAGTRLSAPISR